MFVYSSNCYIIAVDDSWYYFGVSHQKKVISFIFKYIKHSRTIGALTSNVRKRRETKKQQNTKLELKTILDTAQYYELGVNEVNVNIKQNNMQNKRTYLIQQYTQRTRRKCNSAPLN